MSKASTVRDIRETLAVADEVSRQSISKLAEAYDQAVRDFYDRLNRCRESLQAGRIAEARQVATEPIGLAQEYDMLNFEGLGEWLDVCARRDLSIPPLLDTARLAGVTDGVEPGDGSDEVVDLGLGEEQADAVNLADFDEKSSAASTADKQADTRQRKSQLQAARRRCAELKARNAAVVDRLAALRRVVELAPDDDQARQELGQLEAAGLDELEARVARAENAGDIEELQALARRIEKGPWIVRSPEGLLGNLAEVLRSGKQRMAQRRYAELTGELGAAMAEGKLDTVKNLLAEAEKVHWKTGVTPDDQTDGIIDRAQRWAVKAQTRLEKKRRFEQACHKLRGALASQSTPGEHLESLLAGIERFDEPMPATLRHRCERRIEQIRRRRRKCKWMSIAAGALCFLLIGGVVGYGVWTHLEGKEAAQWRGRIESALESDNLDEARGLAESLHGEAPGIYRSQELQAVLTRLSRRLDREAKRAQQFDALMDQAEAEGFVLAASGDDRILQEASQLARTDQEHSRVQAVRDAVEENDRARREERLKAFEREMRELSAAADAVRTAAAADADDLPSLARKALGLGHALLSDQVLTREDREPAQRIVEEVERLRREYEQRRRLSHKVETYLTQLHAASWNVELYCRMLETFLERYPHAAATEELKQVIGQVPLWRSEANWSELSKSWDSVLAVSSPATIRQRRKALAAFQSACRTHLHGEFLSQYDAYLARAQQAWTDEGLAGRSRLVALLQLPAVREATMVKTTDGRRFYLHKSMPKQVTINDRPVGHRLIYLTNLEGKIESTTIEMGDMAGEPTKAPHSVLAETLSKEIAADDADRDWPVLYLSLARIVQQARQADPVFRAGLMRMLLESAIKASLAPDEDLRRLLKGLQQEKWEADWLDPTDSDADKQRVKARAVLSDLPDLASRIVRARESVASLRETMVRYSAVGVALPDEVKLTANVQAGDTLYVLRLVAGKGPRVEEVGRVDRQGRAVIDDGASPSYGMLLFTRTWPLKLQ